MAAAPSAQQAARWLSQRAAIRSNERNNAVDSSLSNGVFGCKDNLFLGKEQKNEEKNVYQSVKKQTPPKKSKKIIYSIEII